MMLQAGLPGLDPAYYALQSQPHGRPCLRPMGCLPTKSTSSPSRNSRLVTSVGLHYRQTVGEEILKKLHCHR
jgi:hypothetical protein